MKKLTSMIALCVALCLSAASARAAWNEWPPRDLADYPPAIEKAVEYAVCYNPSKAEQITQSLIEENRNKKIVARAWWVRALAWGNWCVNYRDASNLGKYDEARKQTESLDPSLLGDQLATLDANLLFYVKSPNRAEENLALVLKQTENRAADAASLALRGKAYLAAADLSGPNGAKRPEYLAGAADAFRRALDLAPESYEFSAHLITALVGSQSKQTSATQAQLADAAVVARKAVQKTGGRPYYFDSLGPNVLEAVVQEMHKREKGLELKLVRNLISAGNRQPELIVEQISGMANTYDISSRDFSGLWWRVIRGYEDGSLPLRGYDLRLLARAYYKLGSSQAAQNLPDEALDTYLKLAAISPRYAQLNYNIGIVYSTMAQQAKDPAEQKRLREEARKAYEREMEFNYQGRGRQQAEQALKALE